jgi:rod shape-determining protein MreC
MWNIIKEYRHYMATLVLVVVPLLAMNAAGKSPAQLYWFDRAALAVSAPVQAGVRWTIETTWDAVQSYLFLFNTQENNLRLAQTNRKLLNEIAGLQEMSLEHERLKKVVSFQESLDGKKVVAQVIAQDVSPEFRMIRINKGEAAGIETGMAVVALEGVVGRVIRVSKDFSDVLTLLDSSSAIDGLIQRNRSRGIVEGLGGLNLSMKYLRRTDEVLVDDVILSSGIGGLFPKGLNIGKVISASKKNYGISQDVEVAPAVDFHRLEEVVVVDPPKQPIDVVAPVIPVVSTAPGTKPSGANSRSVPAPSAPAIGPTTPPKPAPAPPRPTSGSTP